MIRIILFFWFVELFGYILFWLGLLFYFIDEIMLFLFNRLEKLINYFIWVIINWVIGLLNWCLVISIELGNVFWEDIMFG